MRRDMDLIRELMLKLEALPLKPGAALTVASYEDEFAIDGYSQDEIDGHLFMIFDADFALGGDSDPRMLSGEWIFRRLTPAGHDFVDAVRDPETWKKTKTVGKAAGGWTLDTLSGIAKSFIKEGIRAQLAKHGVPFLD